jgi:argininosuccinate lyase
MDASLRLDQAINTLQRTIVSKATEMQSIVMPAYTHMQRAIPVSAAHWLLGHFWPLQRDRVRLRAARTSASVIPLGSGAVAGAAYPIPRVLLQGSLGFDSLSPNSVDAVSDRDFAAELIFSCALLAIHLSRLAEDLIIYGSSEFGFVQFGEAFTSGSSMMPQKRNPDALELARGSAARTLGDLTTLLATLKGLPSSYNKDLQDDKRVLFDAVDTTILVLTGTNGALAEARFNQARMQEAVSAAMMATDLADYLVRKGVAFRDAHGAVGRLVRLAEAEGKDLDSLPIEAFASVHASFGDDIADALSPRHSLNSREVDGGTGPAALRAQVEAAKRALTS